MSGPPRWFSATLPGGQPGDATTNGTIKTWLNDPRFANANRSPFQSTFDNTSYRIIYDARDENGDGIKERRYLIVSFEVPAALDSSADTQDAVYFGVSDGNTARAVKIDIPQKPVNATADVPTPLLTGFQYASATKSGTSFNWTLSPLNQAAPAWLVAPAIWLNQLRDGEAWGVNMKVDLNDLDESRSNPTNLAYPDNATLRLYLGMNTVNQATLQMSVYRTPSLNEQAMICDPSTPTGGCTAGMVCDPTQPWPDDPSKATCAYEFAFGSSDQHVYRDPARWMQIAPLSQACAGISLPRDTIGAKNPATAGANPYENPSTSIQRNTTPTLVASPTLPNGDPPEDGTIRAGFRIAHWGSVAATDGWTPIVQAGGQRDVSLQGGHFDFPCPPSTSSSTCGIPLSTLAPDPNNPSWSHQCMLVEMSGAQSFSSSSEYRNMAFEKASTVNRLAAIDVKGLQRLTGTARNRDVYLYVRRRNMPPRQTALLPELPRLDMFRARSKMTGELQCDAPDQSCINYSCATACVNSCPSGMRRLEVAGCWCVPSYSSESQSLQVCLPPAEGQGSTPALPDEDELARIWPTIRVYPYWDTGRTRTIKGKTFKVMKPMYPFGMFVDHEGAYYGWTDSFTGSDVTVTKVATDFYKLTIPNEGRKLVKVSVTAHEQSLPTLPLTTYQGSATPTGAFAVVQMVSLASSNLPINLAQATVTMDKLLASGSTDLITNMPSRLLSPLPFSLPNAATFVSSSGPPTTMLVVELPLVGRVVAVGIANATVTRPSTCNPWFGKATLTTQYTIRDATNPARTFAGQSSWTCNPIGMTTP